MENTLYYGDNLKVLRDYIPDASVDLIYLDPPFNSNRSYNVLFKDESGSGSDAQITAFDDAWHWGETAERTYDGLISGAPLNVSMMIESLRKFIGANQMMAYLVMMAARLAELHRVLKPSGSLYLHCDPTASHYLKIILDTIFGVENFRNEVIWKRTFAHSSSNKYGPLHDIIFFYSKSNVFVWNSVKENYDPNYIGKHFTQIDDKTGKPFQPISLTGAGVRNGDSGKPWRGINPTQVNRHWALPGSILRSLGKKKTTVQEGLDALDTAGRIYWPKKTDGTPRLKWFADDASGTVLSDTWVDIAPISAQAQERLGYPTQKPLALLERILEASSNPGDVVLDPFSGCGTCIAAAQKLGRKWIGIDITHLAIAMHKARLKDMFGLEAGKDYRIVGEPEDLEGARQLKKDDPYQFQWWALSLIGARPYGGSGEGKAGKKGSDRGIDGMIYFQGEKDALGRAIVQVKSGHVNSGMVRDLKGVLEREKAEIGIFITLEEPSRDMETEAVSSGFYRSEIWQKNYPRVQMLTVEEILAGKRPDLPPTPQGAGAFKKAEKVKKGEGTQGELGI